MQTVDEDIDELEVEGVRLHLEEETREDETGKVKGSMISGRNAPWLDTLRAAKVEESKRRMIQVRMLIQRYAVA